MSSKMEQQTDQLDPRILTTVITLSVVEYEIFTFSKITVAAAKQDAWLSLILGALIGLGLVLLLVKLAARFPGKGYFEYLKIVWGSALGTLWVIVYLLYFLLFLVLLFYETALANQLLFLPKTPRIVPLLIFAGSLIWLIANGITPIVRFFQLMLPFLLLPILVLTVLFIRSIDFDNFLPVLGEGFLPVLKGAFYFLGATQGPEVLLFLAPWISRIDRGAKPALLGYATPAFVGWSSTIAAIGVLGVEGVKEALLPGIVVVTLIELPGFPVERFGLLLTLPWLIGIYTTLAIYLYLFSDSLIKLCNLRHKTVMLGLSAFLPLAFSFLIPDVTWHDQLRFCLTLATPVLVYALPVVTLGLALIRKKGKG